MKEALNILEKRPHNPRKRTIWHRVVEFEKLTRSPTSIFALKTACAATVYATLMWGDKTRDWFVSYGLAVSFLVFGVGFVDLC